MEKYIKLFILGGVLIILVGGGFFAWQWLGDKTEELKIAEGTEYQIQSIRKELAQKYNFSYVGDFSTDGIARVSSGNQWYYIDTSGREITSERFAAAYPFKEGIGLVLGRDAKYYYIDVNGKKITNKGFDLASNFSNGLAHVQEKRYEGFISYFIDKNGENVLGPFDGAGSFYEGVAPVEKDGKSYLIDKTGVPINDETFSDISSFSEGLAMALKDGKYYFIDKTGKQAINKKFALAFPFSDGVAKVYEREIKEGQFYFIDKSGKKVIAFNNPKLNEVAYFNEGLSVVYDYEDSKYYFIDKNGGKAFNKEFDLASPFSESVAFVRKGADSYYIDHEGNPVFLELTKLDKSKFMQDFKEVYDFGYGVEWVSEIKQIEDIDKDGYQEFLVQAVGAGGTCVGGTSYNVLFSPQKQEYFVAAKSVLDSLPIDYEETAFCPTVNPYSWEACERGEYLEFTCFSNNLKEGKNKEFKTYLESILGEQDEWGNQD